jgi:hypothetical protein
MDRPIPDEIVACVQELAASLGAWCEQGRDRTLAEHEEAVLARVRAALPGLPGGVVRAATSGLDPRLQRARAACPECGRKAAPWERARGRTVETRCGTVTLAVPWHHCAVCKRGWSVVGTTLGVPARARLSAGLHAWVVRLGATTDHREAAALLAELTGLAVGRDTVRRHTTAAGAALADAEDAALAEVERTRAAAEPVDAAPGHLLVEADGVMVRQPDGWHEAKVAAVGGVEDGEATALSYVAAREGPARFGPRVLAEAARRGALDIVGWTGPLRGRGLARLRPVVVLGDGARWIWELAAEHFGACVEILDYYHAGQHLWELARALFGRDAPEAAAWAAPLARRLRDEGAAPVLAALTAAVAPDPAAAEVLRRERAFFRTNAARMAYPTFRARGFPIGSGAVESAARHVVQARMKRPGMRRSDSGARAMLALRAHLRSGRPLTPAARAA